MRVGIYAPMYNVAPYVKEMIDSVFAQTMESWELVLFDDGSEDGSYEAALKASKNDPRISVHKTDKNIGVVGKVKKHCVSLFKTSPEFYCCVDSDDIIIPKTLETYTSFMDKNKDAGACCGNFICFDSKGNKWSYPHVANTGEFNSDIILQYMSFFPLRMYRSEAYHKAGGYCEDFSNAEDYDLALRLDETTTIKRIKDPICYLYRQHPKQISSRVKGEENGNAKMALERALKRRNISGKITNDVPPFKIEKTGHFIWGKQ